VVPSFNNTADDRYINNMNSILMQEYKNYHIVFIDDASPDGLGEKVKLIMQSQVIVPP
jgi:glycosyltransferase involved in cell wall biosynthesis